MNLTVTGSLKDAAGILHLVSQPDGIHNLAVVHHGKRTAMRDRQQRLYIFQRISPGSRITHMPDRNIPLKFRQFIAVKDLGYQSAAL